MTPPLARLLPVLAFSVALLAGIPALAFGQDRGQPNAAGLPPWVVPVLRLVSSTHVEPTTGVVLSESGLVLVPQAFGAEGDEIVVLDGGTDVVRNGRPARVERTFPELGLKVLAVEGMSRHGAPLSALKPADDGTVELAAFPPAERIEEGAPPLREKTRLSVAGPGAASVFALKDALPNVTGALLDACGNLLGFSIADGVQTMSPSPQTQYRSTAELGIVLDALGLASRGVPCAPLAATATAAEPQAPPAEEPAPEGTPEIEPGVETEAPGEETPPPQEPAVAEPTPLDTLPPVEADQPAGPADIGHPAAQPEEDARGSFWGWLAAALLAFAAGGALHRVRTRSAARPGPAALAEGDAEDGQPAEPPELVGPDVASADCRLSLRGQYADGRDLRVSIPVSGQAINLEIGRGRVDLVLESRAVSRRHARLGGTADALTLADLGSGNGSSINGVPCLEGEVMYVRPGDRIILGDVRFEVDLEATDGGADRS